LDVGQRRRVETVAYVGVEAGIGDDGEGRATATATEGIIRSGPRAEFDRCTARIRRPGTVEFTRITIDPRQMGGVPCIRGLRIPVATIVDMVADGMSPSEVAAAYPDLDDADVREALQFAAAAVRERELPLAPGA